MSFPTTAAWYVADPLDSFQDHVAQNMFVQQIVQPHTTSLHSQNNHGSGIALVCHRVSEHCIVFNQAQRVV